MTQKVVKYVSLSPRFCGPQAFFRFAHAQIKQFGQENKQNKVFSTPTEPFEAADKLAQAIGKAFPFH